MKVGDLVRGITDDAVGVVLTMPYPVNSENPYFYDHGLMEGDVCEIVTVCMPWGMEQYATDELETVSESR